MNLKTSLSLATLAASAVLAGCASDVKLSEPAPVESRTAMPVAAGTVTQSPGARPTGTPQSSVATVNLTQPAGGTPSSMQVARIVYFDFDSFTIKDEFKPMIESHAKALAALRTKKLTVEGHTDERGGSEYNLALGQKRAEAVVRSLALLGAGPAQVEAVSFGEERPADTGHGETAWAQNRRVEIRYDGE